MSKLEEQFTTKFESSVKDQGEIPEHVTGKAIAAGVATGTVAAAGTAATVAAVGAASTGTAIATLHGAAATSALLAWFGGGSLAAGGWGVAGGLLVLGTGGVAAAAIGGIGAYMFMARKRPVQPACDGVPSGIVSATPVAQEVPRDAAVDNGEGQD